MPREELADWQKAAIEPLFHSVAEWSAEAIGGAIAAASKEHKVNALLKAMLNKAAETPGVLPAFRFMSRTSKHALIRFLQHKMPRRIGTVEFDDDFVHFMRGAISSVVDGLGDRLHQELTPERLNQLVDEKVPVPASTTPTAGAAGPGAPMP